MTPPRESLWYVRGQQHGRDCVDESLRHSVQGYGSGANRKTQGRPSLGSCLTIG